MRLIGVMSFDASEALERKRELRTEKIRQDIATRLRPVCSHLPEDEFAALVDKITSVQLRGEGRW